MRDLFQNRAFTRLLAAQVVALLGTGLLTIALGLLAFDLAGEDAGVVLSIALAIKMVAYVALAPVANALATTLPRKTLLIGADAVRATVALSLPFVDEVWQIYGLIFVLQAASAAFTPAFQATLPDVLPEEEAYTRALSLSRLAADLENLMSPLLAGLLLLVMSFHWLFMGTFAGFVLSALCVLAAPLPARAAARGATPFGKRLTQGTRIYWQTPRLRGLFGVSLAAASSGAFVIVNTVVIVQAGYGGGEAQVAVALAAFGAGSMVAALALPRVLQSVRDRGLMIAAAVLLSLVSIGHAAAMAVYGLVAWPLYVVLWAISGLFYSAITTPSGRVLTRSSHAEDRASVFAAQFAYSHACWLVTYPIAGYAGRAFGMPTALAILGVIGLLGAIMALSAWPAQDPDVVEHDHPDLPEGHPHLAEHAASGGAHAHVFWIDDAHRRWPS